VKATLDGDERALRDGAVVASLLDSADQEESRAGRLAVVDGWGHVVGGEGAVAEGGAYVRLRPGARPPAMPACLEAWTAFGLCLPGELVKFALREAIARLRAAGGAASARGTAALAAAFVRRRDSAVIWAYVAGEGRGVGVRPAGTAKVGDWLPAVRSAVIAARDMFAFATGVTVKDYFAGSDLREVGTTNKVGLPDYEKHFGTADAVASCGVEGFEMEGFVASPTPEELGAAARAAGLPFVNLRGGAPLFDADASPRRYVGDVVILVAPPELPRYDVVFTPAAGGVAGGEPSLAQAAAKLWAFLEERVAQGGKPGR